MIELSLKIPYERGKKPTHLGEVARGTPPYEQSLGQTVFNPSTLDIQLVIESKQWKN